MDHFRTDVTPYSGAGVLVGLHVTRNATPQPTPHPTPQGSPTSLIYETPFNNTDTHADTTDTHADTNADTYTSPISLSPILSVPPSIKKHRRDMIAQRRADKIRFMQLRFNTRMKTEEIRLRHFQRQLDLD